MHKSDIERMVMLALLDFNTACSNMNYGDTVDPAPFIKRIVDSIRMLAEMESLGRSAGDRIDKIVLEALENQ